MSYACSFYDDVTLKGWWGKRNMLGKPFWEQGIELYDAVHNVGVRSHYKATLLALPMLRKAKSRGLIVNTNSLVRFRVSFFFFFFTFFSFFFFLDGNGGGTSFTSCFLSYILYFVLGNVCVCMGEYVSVRACVSSTLTVTSACRFYVKNPRAACCMLSMCRME